MNKQTRPRGRFVLPRTFTDPRLKFVISVMDDIDGACVNPRGIAFRDTYEGNVVLVLASSIQEITPALACWYWAQWLREKIQYLNLEEPAHTAQFLRLFAPPELIVEWEVRRQVALTAGD